MSRFQRLVVRVPLQVAKPTVYQGSVSNLF